MFQGQENRAGEEDYRSRRKTRAENTVPLVAESRAEKEAAEEKEDYKGTTRDEQGKHGKIVPHRARRGVSGKAFLHHSQFC